jgi:septal ring factor EnvC (AmiA/AmiB activator)
MRVARLLAAALLCVLVLMSPGAPARDSEDLKALRARIDSLKSELDQKEATRRESRDALRESERAISDAGRELKSLESEAHAAQDELKTLGAKRRELGEGLERQQIALSRMLAARYAAGPPDVLRVALSGADPNDAARDLYYLGMISRSMAKLLGRFKADAADLERVSAEVREKAARLEALEAGKRVERHKILVESRQRKRVLERLAGDIRAGRKEIRSLVADESRLARLVEEIGKVLTAKPGAGYSPKAGRSTNTKAGPPITPVPESGADTPDGLFSSLRGKLRLPVRGELVSRFGSPRTEGGGNSKGVFIRSAEGQQVRSIAAGRVVFADWMRGFGNLLIVDHGETFLSVYGNNEALLKQPGDAVSAGEAIATVGSTGGSAETGLYFELRHLGKAFDPLRWSNLR